MTNRDGGRSFLFVNGVQVGSSNHTRSYFIIGVVQAQISRLVPELINLQSLALPSLEFDLEQLIRKDDIICMVLGRATLSLH